MIGLISRMTMHMMVANPLVCHAHTYVVNNMSSPVAHNESATIPAHLYMPPNPPAPGRMVAEQMKLPYLLAERTTNYYHASPSQAKNIELVAKRLNGIVLKPGQVFSYNHVVGPYTASNGFHWGRAFDGDRIVPSMGGGVCQGASTLYSALLRTDIAVVERHPHGLTVPYLPPGEDATVAASAGLDFRIKNTESTPIMIEAEAFPEKRFLTVCLWGAQAQKPVQVEHRIDARFPYETIHKHSTSEAATRVLFPGQDGVKVDTWVEVGGPSTAHRRWVGTDTYRASPRVVVEHTLTK